MTCKWKELTAPPAPLESIAEVHWEDLVEESQLIGLTGDPEATTDYLVASIPNDRLDKVLISYHEEKVYLWCESAEGDWYLYVYSCGLSTLAKPKRRRLRREFKDGH